MEALIICTYGMDSYNLVFSLAFSDAKNLHAIVLQQLYYKLKKV